MDTHVICTSITRYLRASFALFPTVFKLTKSVTDIFAQTQFSKDNINSEICYSYD